MKSYIVLVAFAVVSLCSAKPAVVSPLAYSTSSLYSPTGSSQVEVRNNYNSATGYSTSLGYGSPLMGRVLSPLSAYAYTAPSVSKYSPSVVPIGYTAPIARYESPFAGASYLSPYSAYGAQSYTPFSSNYASPYAAAYASPYQIAASGPAPIFL